MASGGARARSGPPKQQNSGRSERLGVEFFALDPNGYQGTIPTYPLGPPEVFHVTAAGDRVDDEATAQARAERELALWEWAWRTPQASAWILEPWRFHSVAMWVRTAAICESGDAKAADKSTLLRLADQIGLTPQGLALNLWYVAVDAETSAPSNTTSEQKKKSSRDRMPTTFEVVEGGGAA